MSDSTGDDVPRDPWGNPLGPEDRAPLNPQPDDYPPPFPNDPPGGSAPPSPWTAGQSTAPPEAPPAPPTAPGSNPAWPGAQPDPAPPLAPPGNPAWPGSQPTQPPPGWGGPGVPPQQPYYPPGANPGWGQAAPWAPPKNDGRAIGSLVCAIVGLLCFGIVLEPVAIVLALVARRRIRESNGTLKGDGLAIAAIAVGVVGLLLAVVGMIILIRNPDALDNIFSGLT